MTADLILDMAAGERKKTIRSLKVKQDKAEQNERRKNEKKGFCIGMNVRVPLDRSVNVPWVENFNQLN